MTNHILLWIASRVATQTCALRTRIANEQPTAFARPIPRAGSTYAEFQQRVERCYKAITVGELEELVTDLPRQDERDEGRSLRRFPAPRVRPGAVGRDPDRAARDLGGDRPARLLALDTAPVYLLEDVLVAS